MLTLTQTCSFSSTFITRLYPAKIRQYHAETRLDLALSGQDPAKTSYSGKTRIDPSLTGQAPDRPGIIQPSPG